MRQRILRLGCKSNHQQTFVPALHNFGKNVFCRLKLNGQRAGTLQLLLGLNHRTVISHRRSFNNDGGFLHPSKHSRPHLLCGGHRNHFAAQRRTQRRRRAYQNHLRASPDCGLGQRMAHLAARPVAEKAHRVEGFAGASRSDKHSLSSKIIAVMQHIQHRLYDHLRFRQTPLPIMPQARYPLSGETMRTPRPSSSARFACVAGWFHIFTFIAGATITGAVVARYIVVRKSSAIPCANLARMLAVAGATTSASVEVAASICSIAEARWPSSGSPAQRPVMTLCPVREANVSGWMNCCAASVITT